MYAIVSCISEATIGNQLTPNMSKQVFFVMISLCFSGRSTAIALSIVSGSKASKPENPKLITDIAYATQFTVMVSFGAPTNLLSTIPSPLNSPTIDIMTSLTATLMIRRF